MSVEKRVEVGRGLEILCSAQEIGLTIYFERFLAYMYIREAAKKDPPLMARPLRPYPPPLLMAWPSVEELFFVCAKIFFWFRLRIQIFSNLH